MRIALATCMGDLMFPQAPEASVHLLERLGHEVVFPDSQGCCGQMHINTGYFPEALIENHVRTFEPVLDGEWDARRPLRLLHRSAGPPGRNGRPLRRDARNGQRAAQIAEKTYDLSELLVDILGLTDVGAYFPTASPTIRPVTPCASPASATGPAASSKRSRASTSSTSPKPNPAADSAAPSP